MSKTLPTAIGPCPFCAQKLACVATIPYPSADYVSYYVCCTLCRAAGPMVDSKARSRRGINRAKNKAIRLWNTQKGRMVVSLVDEYPAVGQCSNCNGYLDKMGHCEKCGCSYVHRCYR